MSIDHTEGESPQDYSWLVEDMPAFGAAGCVTMIEEGEIEGVLAALGVGAETPATTDLQTLYETATPAVAFADRNGGWLPMIEWNGIIGTIPDVLRKLSTHGRVASCCWNVNLDCKVSLASQGEHVYSFEVGMSNTEIVGDVQAASSLNRAFGEPGPNIQQWGMAMLSRVTGVYVDRQMIENANHFYVVPMSF